MFFNCVDRDPSVLAHRKWRNWNRPAAAIALAVASAAPAVLLGPKTARAATMNEMEETLVLLSEQAAPTDPELLSRGSEELAKGQYENAQVTLQRVKKDSLSPADQQKLTDTLGKVEAALAERQAARAAFERGEDAMREKNTAEAVKQYRAAADNKFADDATKNKALSQIAVANAMSSEAPKPADNKALYKEAVADYKAGRMDVARAKFVQVQEAGYKGGLFDRRPSSYISDIDAKLAAPVMAAAPAEPAPTTQPAPAVAQGEQPPMPTAENEVGIPTAKDDYRMGVDAYRRGDNVAARAHFAAARDAGYKPGLFERAPSRYLTMIDEKEKAEQPAVAAALPPSGTNEPAQVTAAAPAPAPAVSPAEDALQTTARLEKLKQEQKAYEAQQLVVAAQKAQQDNRPQDAYSMFRRAAELDPSNKTAVEGAAAMQTATVGGGGGNLLQSEKNRIDIERQIVKFNFDKAIENTDTALKAQRFDDAERGINSAQVARASATALFNTQEVAEFDSRISIAQVELGKAREAAAKSATAAAIAESEKNAKIKEQEATEEQRRTVVALTKQARQLMYEGSYSQALGVLNHVLAIDPANEYAIGVKPLVEDKDILQKQKDYKEQHDRESMKQLNGANEKLIPYMEILRYPSNWPDISELRDREVDAERSSQGGESSLAANLERNLPGLSLDNVALTDAVDTLRGLSNLNIWVNWRTLETAGVQPNTPIHLKGLHDIATKKALDLLLADAAGNSSLSYSVDEGVITVSTADDLNKKTVTNVYDILDLLVVPPDFIPPPDFDLSGKTTMARRNGGRGEQSIGGGGTAGSSSYYSNSGSSGGPLTGNSTASRGNASASVNSAARTEKLIQDITQAITTVDRDSWVENGGQVGSLKFLSGQLIVTQTPENQRRVLSLLDKLRETRAIQVSIETRFLQIQRSFLNDIGVDLDFFFNINDPNHFSPISVSQSSNVFPATPTTPVPGSIGATAQPAVTIQGSFLDDFQVNFLIRATQATLNSTVLTAPRVTVFNGQQAFVVVSAQQAYVGDLEAVTGDNVGLFNPIISTVQSGVRLVVQPTVSADRKYVTLSLQPQVSQLVSLVNFPVFGVTTGAANTGGTGGTTQNQVFTGNVQLPLIQLTSVNTIVSVPDGGTLLLGGQTLAGETEVEEGVPILSKIPFIKRLFTNKSVAKDEQVLLIMVKPNIIIQKELESEAFPLMNTKR